MCLFVYIHIYSQWKTSSDLEVYDIDFTSKEHLNDMCETRQPIRIRGIFNMIEFTLEDLVDTHGKYEVNIVSLDTQPNRSLIKDDSLLLPITLSECLSLLQKQDAYSSVDDTDTSKTETISDDTRESKDEDDNSKSNNHIYKDTYLSWENNTFVKESGLEKGFKMNDIILRPPLLCKSEYDLYMGNDGTISPLRYSFAYRNYFHIHSGEIRMKLIPPIYSRYLQENCDHLKMIYTSPINCWSIQDEYKKDYDKVKSIDVHMKAGDTIYIPSYWWWSIKFENISMVEYMKYYTPMNMVANGDRYLTHILQNANVKHII